MELIPNVSYGDFVLGSNIKDYLVPPLPIPNREVKPTCADGTAMQCGRVGGRPLLTSPLPPNM